MSGAQFGAATSGATQQTLCQTTRDKRVVSQSLGMHAWTSACKLTRA